MFSKEDMKKAIEFADLFKNSLHDKMLTIAPEDLIKQRYMMDGVKAFITKLEREIKSNESEYLTTLNK